MTTPTPKEGGWVRSGVPLQGWVRMLFWPRADAGAVNPPDSLGFQTDCRPVPTVTVSVTVPIFQGNQGNHSEHRLKPLFCWFFSGLWKPLNSDET